MHVTVFNGSPADRAIVEPIALAFAERRETGRVRWAYGGSGSPHPAIESIPLGMSVGSPEVLAGRIVGASGADVEAALHPETTDAVIVAGDRWDALACAMKAHMRRIPVAHVAAGDRAGCGVFVDESFRDAISTMARWLFASTEKHSARLRVMGLPGSILRTGLPSVDALVRWRQRHPEMREADGPAVVLLHPEPWGESAADLAQSIRLAMDHAGMRRVWLRPNTDPGGDALGAALILAGEEVFDHRPPGEYAAMLTTARVVIGNSSSVVIDCAALGKPSILVGERNRMRQCGDGTMWEDARNVERLSAVLRSMPGRCDPSDVWGDGTAASQIVSRVIADVQSGHRYVTGLHGTWLR